LVKGNSTFMSDVRHEIHNLLLEIGREFLEKLER
jgi:hypothetical protein